MTVRWKVLLFMFAAFAATASVVRGDTSPKLDGWTITAGRIMVVKPTAPGGPREVRGSFKLKSQLKVPGTRRAGACLLADLTKQMVGKSSCTSHDECQADHRVVPPGVAATTVNTAELLFGGNGHGYCISPNKKEPKRCWTRPGSDADYCTKKELAPGEYAVPAKSAISGVVTSVSADPFGNGKPVRWLVLGCLNPAPVVPPLALPPCADPLSDLEVNSTGPMKQVKP